MNRREEGAATIEFLFLGVLMLVPLVYLMLTTFAVQRASYAVAAASREAGRVWATTGSWPDAVQAADLVMDDAGLPPADLDASGEHAPGAALTVDVSYAVPLPFTPPFIQAVVPVSVTVHGEHVAVVDPYSSS